MTADDNVERMIISVRADTAGFARDVSTMRGELEGPLAAGAGRAGRMIEGALARAVVNGKFGFDDLKRVALSAMAEIAAASLRSLFRSSGGGSGGGLGSLIAAAAGSASGSPGRATGGPVSQGRPYMVGERGPELFVPSSAGRVETIGSNRSMKLAISVHAAPGTDVQALQQSSRQIARAVRSAIRADQA
jgi:hypothetical protein